jgi:Raf kinase inhibitor-like YbhB/YbcL family protein
MPTLRERWFSAIIAGMRIDRTLCSALQWASVTLFVIATPMACTPSPGEQDKATGMTLSSSSLTDGTISKKHTCDGDGSSPALSWTAPPAGTQSYALIMSDLDAPVGFLKRHLFVHWVLYALPATTRELPEAMPAQAQLADGSRQGKNGTKNIGYAGPCPSGSAPHRYAFTLYALDSKPDLPDAARARELLKAMHGHVVGGGQLLAKYHR